MTMCQPATTSIGPELFEDMLNQTSNPQLIDVRTPAEFADGYLEGAKLIDISQPNFETLINQLDKSRPVFVYCRLGRRSLTAARILEKNDFKLVYNLEGGIVAWRNDCKPVVYE